MAYSPGTFSSIFGYNLFDRNKYTYTETIYKLCSTIKLPEKAGGKNNVNTQFTLTSPSNKSYEAVLPANVAISPAMTNGYYSPSDMDSNKYDYGVEYGANNTKLLLNSLAAFESVGFEMENKSTTKGTVEIDVKKNEKQISGYISNKMSCGLEDCIFLLQRGYVLYRKPSSWKVC